MNLAVSVIEYFLRDPKKRLINDTEYMHNSITGMTYDEIKYFLEAPDSFYETLCKVLMNNGYEIKLKKDTYIEWDGHRSIRNKFIKIISNIEPNSCYINSQLGKILIENDVNKFIKRSKPGIQWNGNIFNGLIRPGSFGRILELKDNLVLIAINTEYFPGERDIDTIRIKNDDGYIMLT